MVVLDLLVNTHNKNESIKTQGYAQAVGFNPGTAPNTAAQQKAQDDEFIRQFKESKEIEIEQEATALAQLKKRMRLSVKVSNRLTIVKNNTSKSKMKLSLTN